MEPKPACHGGRIAEPVQNSLSGNTRVSTPYEFAVVSADQMIAQLVDDVLPQACGFVIARRRKQGG